MLELRDNVGGDITATNTFSTVLSFHAATHSISALSSQPESIPMEARADDVGSVSSRNDIETEGSLVIEAA
jgi:hypothetical protein